MHVDSGSSDRRVAFASRGPLGEQREAITIKEPSQKEQEAKMEGAASDFPSASSKLCS